MGIRQAKIVTRHRRFSHRAAIHEKTNADRVEHIPVGIFKSDDCRASNPRLLMMILLKVVRPAAELDNGAVLKLKQDEPTSIWNIDGDVK